MMDFGWNVGPWGVFWMILCVGVIVALVWAAFHAFAPYGGRPEAPHDPKDVLAQRFANGEIGANEYQERLRVLEETRTPTATR